MPLITEFNQFAGKQISLFGFSVDQNDPIAREIREIAKQKIMRVRFILPDSMVTKDFIGNRLNVHLRKHSNGKHVIKSLNLG